MSNSRDNKMHSCQGGKDCGLAEIDLDKVLAEHAELGAIPHCFFPELCEKNLVVALNSDFSSQQISFYSSPQAFYGINPVQEEHIHISLAQMMAGYPEIKARFSFIVSDGQRIELTGDESQKLVEQALEIGKHLFSQVEEIEVEEGQQMIFSTPDPDLPQEFLNYLGKVFSGIDGIAAVYAFETTVPGQTSNLVIALQPINKEEHSGLEKLSMLVAEGANDFLPDRNQIDFMVLEDPELIELIASVSPEISLA